MEETSIRKGEDRGAAGGETRSVQGIDWDSESACICRIFAEEAGHDTHESEIIVTHGCKSHKGWKFTEGGWHEMELFYLRDKQKREVDFLITKDKKPCFMIESKISSKDSQNHLEHFSQQLGNIPSFLVTCEPNLFKNKGNSWHVSFNRFMNLLFK